MHLTKPLDIALYPCQLTVVHPSLGGLVLRADHLALTGCLSLVGFHNTAATPAWPPLLDTLYSLAAGNSTDHFNIFNQEASRDDFNMRNIIFPLILTETIHV